MSRDDRLFARVYYEQLEEEFPEMWADAALRGDWLLLLARADKMWPAAPELPRSVSPARVKRLVALDLVHLLPGYRYEVRGYCKARAARQASARAAAGVRWGSDGNADADADASADAVPTPSPSPSTESERSNVPTPAPLPRRAGSRSAGTSPRQVGSSPRDEGGSPRQVRESEKRGPVRLGGIFASMGFAAAPEISE